MSRESAATTAVGRRVEEAKSFIQSKTIPDNNCFVSRRYGDGSMHSGSAVTGFSQHGSETFIQNKN